MKCDLHVHSVHSGFCTIPLFNKICRESYNDPEQVYHSLKRKGMGLVTLTDHDSIDGAERLRHYRDFFLSEEVTCRMPSGTFIHVGVYGLTERQHVAIQRRHDDLPALLAYLSEARLFYSVNHVFSALTGRRAQEDFAWFANFFPALETLNGQMPSTHNRRARDLARQTGKVSVGGSDAHALASVGSAHTEVPNARDVEEFLAGLRAGRGQVGGDDGGYFRLTRDILSIAGSMFREKPLTALLTPLVSVVPLVTLLTLISEIEFARRWSRRTTDYGKGRFRFDRLSCIDCFAERLA